MGGCLAAGGHEDETGKEQAGSGHQRRRSGAGGGRAGSGHQRRRSAGALEAAGAQEAGGSGAERGLRGHYRGDNLGLGVFPTAGGTSG